MKAAAKPQKLQVMVTFPALTDISKRAAVDYVRNSVHSMAGMMLSPGNHLIAQGPTATVKEYKGVPVVATEPAGHTELLDAYQSLQEDYKTRREQTDALTSEVTSLKDENEKLRALYNRDIENAQQPADCAVRVISAIYNMINSIDHTPASPMKHQRNEYWKKGGRDALKKVDEAIKKVSHVLLAHLPEAGDAELFNYWVQEAATRPARLAKALAPCTSPEEYRCVLHRLQNEDKQAAMAGRVNPEGGLAQ